MLRGLSLATAVGLSSSLRAAAPLQPWQMAPKRRSTAQVGEEAPAAPKRTRSSTSSAKQAGSRGREPPSAPATAAAAEPAGPGSHRQGARQYFLMKSEPDVFSIDDLAAKPQQTEHWDGVRSHQAKKVLQSMRVGDHAFFYHSNCKPPGLAGIVEVVREAYPDHTQFDPSSEYYDAASSQDAPRWCMVDCKLVRPLQRAVPLDELKAHREGALKDMALFKYGRLSVQPVTAEQWAFVLCLEQAPAS